MKSKKQDFDSVQSLIIAAAAAMFTRFGVEGASLADIAGAARLAKGTLYYYYPTKDELILDVARAHGDWVGDSVLAWAETLQRETDAFLAIKELVAALLEDDFQRKLHVALVSHSLHEGSPITTLMEDMGKKWSLMLEVGALKLQSKDARLIRARSKAFFAVLTGYMARRSIEEQDIEEFAKIILSK